MLLQRTTGSRLVRNTSWQLVAEGGRLVIQMLSFVVISRALGPEGVGAFAGAMALVFLLVPFAGWGCGHILTMHVARAPGTFAVYWGNALLMIALCGGLLTALALGLAALLVPNLPWALVLTLAVAELLFGKLSDVSAQAFRAFERMRGAAQQMLVEGAFRLAASVLYVASAPAPTPQGWAIWYLAATALESLIGFARVTRSFGWPRPAPALLGQSLSEGWLFSVNLASASIYNNIDKTMMARLATLDATGIYATAYRIIDIAFIPVKSLVSATYPRFFKAGAHGIQGSLAFARRLAPYSVGSGLLIALGLFLAAPLTPYLFGREYQSAIGAIRWLALIPLFRSLHSFAANTLTGAGRQGIRSMFQISVAALNVGLNLWLIPRYSWLGAAWASLISDGALALLLWPAVWLIAARDQQPPKPGSPAPGHTPPPSVTAERAHPVATQQLPHPWQARGPGGERGPGPAAPLPTYQKARVSVIINNHNYGAYLRESIESALCQTYRRLEVIVVDDGSTDASRAIIASYGEQIVPVLKPNGGQSSAFNAGFAHCHGEIVIFLDADDSLRPGIIAQVVREFQAQPALAKVQYRLAVVDAAGAPLGMLKPPAHLPLPSGDLRARVLRGFDDLPWQSTSGNAFAARVLRQIFPVPERAYPPPTGADYYVVNLAPLFGPVVSLDAVGGCYRMHGANNHHHTRMSLERTRDIIRWISTTHIYIQQHAVALGLCPSQARQPASVRFLAHRMASVRLDPRHHPLRSDRPLRLCWAGARAALRRRDLALPLRLLYLLWFVAMLLAPRPLARWLAERLFFPETRRRFNRLLGVVQRAQKAPL